MATEAKHILFHGRLKIGRLKIVNKIKIKMSPPPARAQNQNVRLPAPGDCRVLPLSYTLYYIKLEYILFYKLSIIYVYIVILLYVYIHTNIK